MPNITLKRIDYIQREDRPLEWSLGGLELGPVNLLVGKNATGKSRALNIIASLAKHFLRDQLGTQESGYKATFDNGGKELKYSLLVEEGKVIAEEVLVNGQRKLERDATGLSIYADEMERFIRFTPDPSEVAAAARRDELQHPFLLPLHDWAQSVRSYHFGGPLGQDSVAFAVKNAKGPTQLDPDRDEKRVVSTFHQGKSECGDKYVETLIADMKKLGYEIDAIDTGTPGNVSMSLVAAQGGAAIPWEGGQVLAIGVREKGVSDTLYQSELSQGMFRALSILAQVNYSQMTRRASCILIDDIGEGLDFERSTLLIDLLRAKARDSGFQLIMSTNDQFVMNHVPLEEWSVLQRAGNCVRVRNIHNSPAAFDEFRFVGMSNFAFFEMDFLSGGPTEESTIGHE